MKGHETVRKARHLAERAETCERAKQVLRSTCERWVSNASSQDILDMTKWLCDRQTEQIKHEMK